MTTTELCDLASAKETLERAGATIAAVGDELGALVDARALEGPEGEAFAEAWETTYAPLLADVCEALQRTRDATFTRIGELISGGA
jgi:hypothetical protein